MSLERTHIRSSSRHYSPFLCTICTNVPDPDSAVVTTICSHCFCLPCLETWIYHSFHCPDCNSNLSFSASSSLSSSSSVSTTVATGSKNIHTMMIGKNLVYVQKLALAQPLAFRVLKRIKVSCPLKNKHGCTWEGDYGDLQCHLLSSTEHLNVCDDNNNNNDEMDELLKRNNNETNDVKNQSLNHYNGEHDDDDDDDSMSSCGESCNDTMKTKYTRLHQNDNVARNTKSIKQKKSLLSTKVTKQNQQINPSSILNQRISLAESFKEEANAKFSMRKYVESRALYKKALSVLLGDDSGNSRAFLIKNSHNHDDCKEEKKIAATLHANIAATYMMSREYNQCIDNCSIAIDFDKMYIKAYIRKSKALSALGEFNTSYHILKALIDDSNITSNLSSETKQQITTEYNEIKKLNDLFLLGEEQLRKKEYASAKATFGQLLIRVSPCNASNVLINTARANLGLGLTDTSLRLSLQVLRSDSTFVEGYEVRGLTMQLMGDFESALQLFKEGLRLNPDCDSIKVALRKCRDVYKNVKDARSAVFKRKFKDAIQYITTAIDQQTDYLLPPKAPLYSTLYTERSECYLRLKEYQNSLSDASKVVYSLDDYIPAWIVMANAMHGLGQHEQALSLMEDLMSRFGHDNKIQRAYEKADFEVRKQRRPDFYSIFGVSPLASEMELKKAYKVKAKEFHPDRFSNSSKYTDDQRKEAEQNFKLLGEGLEILCDDFKRQLYDEGYDQEAIRERVAAAQQAAHRKGGVGRQQYHHNH